MTARALLIEVRWPDGRFHGVREAHGRERGRGGAAFAPEWPPSPFRLFQALVAGAYGGRWAAEQGDARADKDAAFEWLEALPPPEIAAPAVEALQPVTYFVPNNDLDAKGGDPAKVGEIRSAKVLRTSLFDRDRPAAYLWRFDGDAAQAERLGELAGRLHTLGHGIDAAFASAEVLDAADAEQRLAALGGSPRRPTKGAVLGSASAPCPARGSLASLRARHAGFTQRLEQSGKGRRTVTRFSQPPKAHARMVGYDREPWRRVYELRPVEGGAGFRAWPLGEAAGLVVAVRRLLEAGLKGTRASEVERCIVGRGEPPPDAKLRLRILPLPSIGTEHTERSIRRVLVEAPPDHPIPTGDLDWALAGRELADANGELLGTLLVPATDTAMLNRYLAPAKVWRTVTPAALPWRGPRGKANGSERARAEAEAAGAVTAALRHAGVSAKVEALRVQREPFEAKGERADVFDLSPFAKGRFDARDLRHVEVRFAEPIRGPLAVGDGRWMGLGVMAPVPDASRRRAAGTEGLHLFQLDGPPLAPADAEAITRALRRAVMARAHDALGLRRGETLPLFFSGHAPGGKAGERTPPAAGGAHEHLFYALDPGGEGRPRLAVIAPHLADRGGPVRRDRRSLAQLAKALDGLVQLRAGRLGVFSLSPVELTPDDPLFAKARSWISATPYHPTRHLKRGQDPDAALVEDVLLEASRRGLPRLETESVQVLERSVGPRGAVTGRLRLRFAVAVRGPLLLGAGSHFGAGLFIQDTGAEAA